jgi:hypothetical protein
MTLLLEENKEFLNKWGKKSRIQKHLYRISDKHFSLKVFNQFLSQVLRILRVGFDTF